MRRAFPFAGWIRPSPPQMRVDVLAGATVAVVAIPQALAYAQLAGVPAHLGLYAAFVPSIVAALWGSCAQLSTGPVALTSLLTAASIAPLADRGEQFVAFAVLLALLSGAMQWIAGLASAGALVERLPKAVVIGFVNAAALMIIFSQMPAMLGVAGPKSPNIASTLRALLAQADAWHLGTAAFGVVSVAAMFVLRMRWPRFPGVLMVSIAAIVASWMLGFERTGGAVVGDLPAGLPLPAVPNAEVELLVSLLPAAATIALVSFVEVLSSSTAITTKTGARWDVDQELIGQGLAKIVSGLFGAFPVSGSFSRSALTFASHARTGWAAIVCALLVAVALVFATDTLHHLPKAVLAAIIILAVSNLLTPMELVRLLRFERGDGVIALTTFAATLASAPHIHYGLGCGIAIAIVIAVWRARGAR